MPDSDVLAVRDFGVALGDRTVLHAVSFTIPARGCTVLLGPSGTGKSTLLRTLAGYNDANPSCRTWGEVHYHDSAAGRPALVLQKSTLLVSDVFENLVTDLRNRSALTRLAQHELVATTLARYGQGHLLEHLTRKVIELPLVEQRLIAVLRLAIASPVLLMVDEPTAGLGPADASRVLDLLEVIARERAVLVVLHNLIEARQIGSQIVLLANGRIEEVAPAAEFFTAPQSESAQAFLRTGSCPEVASAPTTQSVVPTTAVTAKSGGAASAARGPSGFRWLIPGQLGGAPRPGIIHDIRYDLDALREVGITRLISLAEEPIQPALAAAFGITWTMDAMPDMYPPTPSQAIRLCHHIDALIETGDVVTVHCHAGLGRTGTVLAAYRLWTGRGSYSAAQALEYVRRIEGRWVQSPAQVEFLETFALVVADMGEINALPHSQPVSIARGRSDGINH